MVRRAVHLLIIPCLLLSQTATVVAHLHCHDSAGTYGVLPHFHWPSWLSGVRDGHRHGTCGTVTTVQPVEVARVVRKVTADSGPSTLGRLPILATCPEEHDADAVYIGRIPLVAQKRGSFDSGDDDGSFPCLLVSQVSKPGPNLPPSERPQFSRNAPPNPPPIYLQQHRFLL